MSVVLGRPHCLGAVTSYEMLRQRTKSTSSQFLTSFLVPTTTSGNVDSTVDYGKKEGDHQYFIANQLKKKCKKRDLLGIHDRFIRDEKFRKNMIELGRSEDVVRWTNCRTRITRTTSLQMKFESIETTGGAVRILLVPTRCLEGIELISKKHCLPCDAIRSKRISLITKIGKALLHLGGSGKIPGGILHQSNTATMDPALIYRGNLIDGDWVNYLWHDSQN